MDDKFRAELNDKEPFVRVGKIRRHLGFSQKKIASAIGVHWITISRIERGYIRLSREWITKLARALSVNEEDIAPDGDEVSFIQAYGEILKGGKIFIGEKTEISLDKYSLNGDVSYLSVMCSDFEPLIRRLDILKMTGISENQRMAAVDRLCVAKNSTTSTVGFLSFLSKAEEYTSPTWGQQVITDIRGDVLMSGDFVVTSVLTEVILLPSGI